MIVRRGPKRVKNGAQNIIFMEHFENLRIDPE